MSGKPLLGIPRAADQQVMAVRCSRDAAAATRIRGERESLGWQILPRARGHAAAEPACPPTCHTALGPAPQCHRQQRDHQRCKGRCPHKSQHPPVRAGVSRDSRWVTSSGTGFAGFSRSSPAWLWTGWHFAASEQPAARGSNLVPRADAAEARAICGARCWAALRGQQCSTSKAWRSGQSRIRKWASTQFQPGARLHRWLQPWLLIAFRIFVCTDKFLRRWDAERRYRSPCSNAALEFATFC